MRKYGNPAMRGSCGSRLTAVRPEAIRDQSVDWHRRDNIPPPSQPDNPRLIQQDRWQLWSSFWPDNQCLVLIPEQEYVQGFFIVIISRPCYFIPFCL